MAKHKNGSVSPEAYLDSCIKDATDAARRRLNKEFVNSEITDAVQIFEGHWHTEYQTREDYQEVCSHCPSSLMCNSGGLFAKQATFRVALRGEAGAPEYQDFRVPGATRPMEKDIYAAESYELRIVVRIVNDKSGGIDVEATWAPIPRECPRIVSIVCEGIGSSHPLATLALWPKPVIMSMRREVSEYPISTTFATVKWNPGFVFAERYAALQRVNMWKDISRRAEKGSAGADDLHSILSAVYEANHFGKGKGGGKS